MNLGTLQLEGAEVILSVLKRAETSLAWGRGGEEAGGGSSTLFFFF